MEAGLQFLVSGLVIGTIYGLAAIAYTTIFNVTGVINFAQGDMVMLPALVGIAGFEAGAGYAGAVALALLVGGLFLGVVESFATGLVGSGYKSVVAFVLLIGVLLLRPGGLLGRQAA